MSSGRGRSCEQALQREHPPLHDADACEELYQRALADCLAHLPPDWDVARIRSRGVGWLELGCRRTSLPRQGWKIHVSAAAGEAVDLCRQVLAWLVVRRASCKITADLRSIVVLNAGEAGVTQTGKVITVYPRNDDEAGRLAVELDRRWPATAGPAVPSDLAVRPGGAVFLRYGIFAGEILTDRLGRCLPALRAPDGRLVEDRRGEDGRQPDWAPPPPLAGLHPAVPDVQAVVDGSGESYLPLALLQASPRSRVYLGLTLSAAGKVVLKVARRGVGGGLDGQAAEERLHAERRILRQLAGRGLAPRPLDLVEPLPGIAVLVTEHLAGKRFSELTRARQIRLLPRLAGAVARLHAAGFVHRDIKLANALAAGRTVRLVDFELAAAAGSTALLPGGTPGHMPQAPSARASAADDVYSLGASVAHAFLGCDPAALPGGAGPLIGLTRLVGGAELARLLRTLLDARPDRRPPAAGAARALAALCHVGGRRAARDATGQPEAGAPYRQLAEARWCRRAAQEAGLATRRFRQPASGGSIWRSDQPLGSLEAGEGVNTGTAGVMLGLLALDQCSGRGDFRADVAAGAAALAERAPQAAAHGLFTGNAGAALALAVAGRRQDRPDWIAAAHDRLRAGAAGCGDHDLFGGAAGVLWAACLVAEALDDPAAAELAAGCAGRLIATATLDQGLRVWPADEPAAPAATGAAHGSAGIALALAAWGRLARQPAAAALARDTFVRIFKHGKVSRGQTLRRALDGSAAPALSWCHGIAGHLWCLLLAYGDDPGLRQPIDWSVRRLEAATAISSPVYCHGLAGELELWRLLACVPRHRELARRRAASAAAALRLQAQRRDGCCVWSSERPEVVTPDLWVGFLGPATALALHAAGATDALLSGPWLRACARTAHARPS